MESSAQQRRNIKINEDWWRSRLDADAYSASGAVWCSEYLDLAIVTSI